MPPESWCHKDLRYACGYNVNIQRNEIVKTALARGASHVFFIDSDMLFEGITPMQAMEMLYAVDVPITSGMARIKRSDDNEDMFPYTMFVEKPPSSAKFEAPKAGITQEEFLSEI